MIPALAGYTLPNGHFGCAMQVAYLARVVGELAMQHNEDGAS